MDIDSPQSRERVASSEPCATRPNPFDDSGPSSRKRQRVSSGGSRSRSVDAEAITPDRHDPTPTDSNSDTDADPIQPHTPLRTSQMALIEPPNSSKVTINLRASRNLEPVASPTPSPGTPSKSESDTEYVWDDKRINIESEDIGASADAPMEIPSSPSTSGSPRIEVISDEDDGDFSSQMHPVAIVNDEELFSRQDPLDDFPYRELNESLVGTVKKIARFFEYDSVENGDAFCKLRDWMRMYLDQTKNRKSSWYETYVADQEFWNTFPEIIWALNHRRSFFGQFMHRNLQARKSFSQFFQAFAELGARFVALDVNCLAGNLQSKVGDIQPALPSRQYLLAIAYLLRKEKDIPHIGRNLDAHYRWNWHDDMSSLIQTFFASGADIPTLTRLIKGQLALLAQSPKLVDSLVDPCRIVQRAVVDASAILTRREGQQQRSVIESAKITINSGYEFYQVLAPGLIPVVEKYATHLTPDAALAHIQGLSQILYHSTKCATCPAHDTLVHQFKIHPDIPEAQLPYIISQEWKFDMYKRLIVSGQMQLRVAGVTQLCTELLGMFTKHKNENLPEQNPTLLNFANLVLENKLIDYIVGIGSHPEIINESFNIVGFLVATKTYSRRQTDTIWHTVVESQDPRVVDAVLRMLMPVLNLMDYQTLLYLCEKIGELSLDAFTASMRDYCERLLQDLVRVAVNTGQSIDAPPYEMCVRLIRESSIYRPEPPSSYIEVQHFASARLRELVEQGPDAQVRNDIYVSCIEDIATRSPTATGSICALFLLLRQNLATDLRVLTTEHGLTRLMVEELEFTNDIERPDSTPFNNDSPARQARRDLLLSIIVHQPATITPELGLRFWNAFVGLKARSHADRETAWQILNGAAKRVPPQNVFLTTCFREYLPTLDPQCYTTGTLDFVCENITSWLREADGDLLDEEKEPECTGIEQLWQMIIKAPPNTIENLTINSLVDIYTTSPMVMKMSRSRVHAVHSTLITRCLQQLSSAAAKLQSFGGEGSGGEETIPLAPSPSNVHEQELIFTRSLVILREFLRGYQSNPQFAATKARLQPVAATEEIAGDPFDFKYQAFNGGEQSDIKILKVGNRNTIADLCAMLRKATNFSVVRVFHSGQELDVGVNGADFVDGLVGSWVLVRRQDEGTETGSVAHDASHNLEQEIASHFDEMWEYLGMEDKLSAEIYHFLTKFPAHQKLINAFDGAEPLTDKLFPAGQPFKCLYALHALQEHLVMAKDSGKALLPTQAARTLVSVILNNDVVDRCSNEEMRDYLAQNLINTLTGILRETMNPEPLAPFLDTNLLHRMMQLFDMVKLSTPSQTSNLLTTGVFEAMLEVSSKNAEFWEAFISHPKTPRLLEDLLLEDSRLIVRRSAMKTIACKCTLSTSLSAVSAAEFATAFWPMVRDMVPRAVLHQQNCEDVLALALLIFRRLVDADITSVNLDDCLLQWGSLLVQHTSIEQIYHPEVIDMVVRGLAQLLHWCASFAGKFTKQPTRSNLAMSIFDTQLFPRAAEEDMGYEVAETLPTLNPATRKLLYEIVTILTRDDQKQYGAVMDQLNNLVPYLPQEDPPYVMELSFNFDRTKSVRSSAGYVGLRNLSNTCYLNSLFTQLFMNVSFRRFMLNANVAEGASQKLLFETQKLFGYMQNSTKRFVDPSSLAASIRTYDDANIDVSIQMDVDEFYNLLFDRWEGQILSPTDKEEFRSFYGGKLVQQVKSKECPHISDRLEPFSAIQCDIKGKTSLQESLQAYVDGEVMEGDNKYKCSNCDRHVNAVKRACLKDVPDNLIFHLKRFDFNLRTMQRSKINDYFSFPQKIDMRPYKVEHLMGLPEGSQEDIFELVGVLVHSGTAESGHYYSYIRERPSPASSPIWVEFNDDHVSSFDPGCIEANCFGGVDYRGPENGTFQFEKSWSAYMLFYQRSSVLVAQQTKLVVSENSRAVRIPIPPTLSNQISEENEFLMQKYCLYDEFHAQFVLRMLENLSTLNQGQCSDTHELERSAMSILMLHLDQVVSRTKDLPDLTTYMATLFRRIKACHVCSKDFLQWLSERPEAFRQLLLKNPEQPVRASVGTAVIMALNKVKQDAPNDYGLYDDHSGSDSLEQTDQFEPVIFRAVLASLVKMWDTFHLSTRAWPEYFGLLVGMANLGCQETAVFLDNAMLQKMLNVLSWDANFSHHPQYSRMITIISKRSANKQVSVEKAIELLDVLLEPIDLNMDSIPDNEERFDILTEPSSRPTCPLTQREHHLLFQHWTRGHINILLEKLLHYGQNERSTRNIIRMMLKGPDDLLQQVYNTIRVGIRSTATSVSSTPYLQAAMSYCRYMEDYDGIEMMVKHVAAATQNLDSNHGRDHLKFFMDVYNYSENMEDFNFCVVDQMPTWAPSLLTYWDQDVRVKTEGHIHQVLFIHGTEPDLGPKPEDKTKAVSIVNVARALGVACLAYLYEAYVKPHNQAIKIHMVSIFAVIDQCGNYFDESVDDGLDHQFRSYYTQTIPPLRKLTVDEVDEDVSDWDNSDENFSSSEAMDGIHELSSAAINDLNDA